MADLSHWDFAKVFSGYEAAALILGIEPRGSTDEELRIGVVVERMRLDYESALAESDSQFSRMIKIGAQPGWSGPENFLSSVDLRKAWRSLLDFNDGSYELWACDKRNTQFDRQSFDREAIQNWLSLVGRRSVYQFDLESKSLRPETNPRWPWGVHHTDALGHLEAAAKRFWVAYDPSEPSSANTNETVSEWLQKERKVSKTMADSIASMLRPNGLPPGPRR